MIAPISASALSGDSPPRGRPRLDVRAVRFAKNRKNGRGTPGFNAQEFGCVIASNLGLCDAGFARIFAETICFARSAIWRAFGIWPMGRRWIRMPVKLQLRRDRGRLLAILSARADFLLHVYRLTVTATR